ncbi:unnamed protein product [Closterium sp. NIES-64]|nr:unnamed protein product [Closterium sp. NIES-64]
MKPPRDENNAGLVVHDLTEMKVQRGMKTIIATESRDAAIRECRRKVEKISRECRMDNVKYRDPHFDLANMANFCLNGLRQHHEGEGAGKPAAAKRVGDLYDEPLFIVDGIRADDIKQGGAGDCWFLAAVATIANMPKLLKSICVARDERVGVYGFIFFRDGEWISEVIDDQLFVTHPDYAGADAGMKHVFPTEKDYVQAVQRGSNALHFAKCVDSNETWLPLLEKAYAKAHGDYSSIEGGFTGEGVEDLTGGVTSEIITRDILDKDRFWTDELTKVNKELLFACAISGVNAVSVNGIITNHAYSVLQAVEIKGTRLVHVRNPWGESEWTGLWADGSPEWTAEWMTALNHRFGDDGAFWMSYDDFLATFTELDRTRIFTSEWTMAQAWTHVEALWPAEFAEQEFQLTLSKRSPVVIVLQQVDARYFTGLEGRYDFRLHFRVRREGESDYYARSKQTLTMNRSDNVKAFVNAQSAKFLTVAGNFVHALSKAVDLTQSEETEEEEVEEAVVGEEEPETKQQAGEEEGAEEEEEEEDDDTVTVVGVRVYAADPKLKVECAPMEEDVVLGLDPDDTSVMADEHGGYRDGGNSGGGSTYGGSKNGCNRNWGNTDGGNRNALNTDGGNRNAGNTDGGNRNVGNASQPAVNAGPALVNVGQAAVNVSQPEVNADPSRGASANQVETAVSQPGLGAGRVKGVDVLQTRNAGQAAVNARGGAVGVGQGRAHVGAGGEGFGGKQRSWGCHWWSGCCRARRRIGAVLWRGERERTAGRERSSKGSKVGNRVGNREGRQGREARGGDERVGTVSVPGGRGSGGGVFMLSHRCVAGGPAGQ